MDTEILKKEPPRWVVDRLTALGGTNVFGRPNFRVIWGGNRYYRVGGMFKKPITVKDDTIVGKEVTIVTEVPEFRTLLKYNPHRWNMERWRGAEFYGTREEWYQNTWDEDCKFHTMGDYPAEGDYEHVFYLAQCSHMKPGDIEWCMLCQVTSGEYIPLEENVHILYMQIKALQLTDEINRDEERRCLFLREDLKRQAKRKVVEDRVRGAMCSNLALQPTSWQPGMGAKTSVREANLGQSITFNRPRLGFSQSNYTMPDKKQKDLEN